MAINKITPRALDKAADHKLVPATAFIDALNVVVGEDESNGGDDGGDAGVIKNLRGNSGIRFHTENDVIAPGDFKILGSVTDHKMKLVYFFVYHEILSEQGVWVYDPYGVLSLPTSFAISYKTTRNIPLENLEGVDPYEKGTIKLVAKGDYFDFNQNSVVQGNVVYSNSLNIPKDAANSLLKSGSSLNGFSATESERSVFEKDFHLYFTDNVNEPRRINVAPSMCSVAISGYNEYIFGNQTLIDRDLNSDGIVNGEDANTFAAIIVPISNQYQGYLNGVASPSLTIDFGSYIKQIIDVSNLDINNDGVIDTSDIGLFYDYYTANPTPAPPLTTIVQDPYGTFISADGGYFKLPQTDVEKKLFVNACNPVPLSRPSFTFISDPNSKTNNFEKSAGFVFAYQYVFIDGSESSISPYSEVAHIPTVIYQGNDKNIDHRNYNVCKITISDEMSSQFATTSRPPYIKAIKILAKEGDGAFKIVKEITDVQNTNTFLFKNDVIGIPIPSKEESKFFDSLPQKAEAQSVVGNRLVYGNYVEGYPNHGITHSFEVDYLNRGTESFGGNIKVESSLILDRPVSYADVAQKMSGFRITVNEFPEISVGDIVNFSVSFLPAKNFHIYNSSSSYHQSQQLGVLINDESTPDNNYYTTADEAGFQNLKGVPEEINDNSLSVNKNRPYSVFKDNEGVAKFLWNTVDYAGAQSPSQPTLMRVGTSAANPLIVPSGVMTFSTKLRCVADAGSPDGFAAEFIKAVKKALVFTLSGDELESSSIFEIVSSDRISTHSWDIPLTNFEKFNEGDSLSKLISIGTPENQYITSAAFIFKKGSIDFRLSIPETWETAADPTYIDNLANNKTAEFKFIVDKVKSANTEFWTCLRKWHPGSPWWVLSPSYMSSVESGNETMDTFYSQSQFTLPSYKTTAGEALSAFDKDWAQDKGTPASPLTNLTSSNPFNTAGPQFIYRNGFEQKNDASDFNVLPAAWQVEFSGSTQTYQVFEAHDSAAAIFGTRYMIGYLNQSVNQLFDEDSFWFTAKSYYNPRLNPNGLTTSTNGVNYSLMDGEGGPGGDMIGDQLPSGFVFPETSLNGGNPIYAGLNNASSCYGYTGGGADLMSFIGPYFTGRIISNAKRSVSIVDGSQYPHFTYADNQNAFSNATDLNDIFGVRSVLPMVQGDDDRGLIVQTDTSAPISSYKGFSNPLDFVDFKKLPFTYSLRNSHIENFGNAYFNITSSISDDFNQDISFRSFKTYSDHEFGIVFYDEMGRRSFVNSLGSVYVEGYSNAERGGGKGAVKINLNLQNNPPNWADKYQIVYGGNKSIQDFVQYSTNNAFVENSALTEGEINVDVESGKIYVSLNLLQESSISYAKEFGARGKDGGLSIYKFNPGDKLRIISYGSSNERTYPNNFVFDIVETVIIDPISTTQSPLAPVNNDSAQYFGEFVVIRNNESNEGFSYSDIQIGSHNWDQNVIFEIFTPKKRTGEETQVYQEIGKVYDTIDTLGGKRYSTNNISLYEGDVYFRPIALNSNVVDETSTWSDLMAADTDFTDNSNTLQSNFQTIKVESSTATDLHPSELTQFGRYNVATSAAKTVRRESGLIYSEASEPSSSKFNYSSFNASLYPFKDLEEKFGNINFIDEFGGNLIVIQQDRCTLVPISATMLSDAMGSDQLIASNEIMGKERVYANKAGCDNNPESVVRVDNTFYFAHKSTGKIFRFNPNEGTEEISDVGMGSYFRKQFDNVLQLSERSDKKDVRIVGGYDPVKEEYLITILRPKALNAASGGDPAAVYGCTDPSADNYNPQANKNDGTCYYDGTPDTGVAVIDINPSEYVNKNGETGAIVVDFGSINIDTPSFSSGVIDTPFIITNSGDSSAYISNIYFENNQAQVFSRNLGGFVIDPNAEVSLDIAANAPAAGSYSSTLVIEFSQNDGVNTARIPISLIANDGVSGATGIVTVNIYLGGKLIDQQFADQEQGVWTVSIDQNRLIQSINNSYADDGSGTPTGGRALLEAEVILSNTLSATVNQEDFVEITAQITNQLEGFIFTPLD